jgi:cytochrome b561
MSSAKNYSVSWFGLFTWPDLIAKDESNFNILRETHDVLSWALLALAILHVLAALKHHFWDKDTVLRRMLPFTNTETGR